MYQFAHIETYARQPKSGRSISNIVAEAERKSGYCAHVTEPMPPVLLYGHTPSEVAEKATAWADDSKDPTGRKIRKDGICLLAGVITYPREGKDWDRFKTAVVDWLKKEYGDNLESIIEHQDEEHPHLHFYAVPQIGQPFTLHAGRAASDAAKREKKSKGEQRKAFADAMRKWQDKLFCDVSCRFGLARSGPKRRRLTRAEWQAEQATLAATAAATQTKARKYSQEEKDHVFDVTGQIRGLLNKETLYTRDELLKVANRALNLGQSLQRDAQVDAAIAAAKVVNLTDDWKRIAEEALRERDTALSQQHQAEQAITALQASLANELKAAETKLSTAMQQIEFLTKENEVLFSENSELDMMIKESQPWSPSA